MNDCHPGCDRCDGCGAHILPGEARRDFPAVAPEDDHEFGCGDRAYHFHVGCDVPDDDGPNEGCREFAHAGWPAYSRRMHRERGCVDADEVWP